MTAAVIAAVLRTLATSISAIVLLFVANSSRLDAVEATANPPVPPEIADASEEAEQSMSGISIPGHWNISLFAAEPNVANVVSFDIDLRGRVYVCESFRQNRGVTDNRAHDKKWLLADLSAETVQDRIDYHKKLLGDAAITYSQHDDRVRRVVDSDGDGFADKSTILADGFNRLEEGTGASVLVRGSDAFYACIPKLWKFIDADDDGVADERIVMSDGYGVRVAFRGHDLHGLIVGPDGRLYFSVGDRGYHITRPDGTVLSDPASGAVFRCELDGSELEVYATGLRNPQELAFNDIGDWFTVDNNSDSGDMARVVQILEDGDTGWRMYYQYLPDRGPFNGERIWEPFHDEQPAYIVPPIANLTDGPSGLAYYPGTGFGDELKDQFLICDFRGGTATSGIKSFQLIPDGAFYQLTYDRELIWSVLATDLAFGPDGSLYISDWVDGWVGLGKGRLFRIDDPRNKDTPIVKEVESLLGSDWSSRRIDQLIRDLDHLDRRVRLEAQWELARRGETAALVRVATDKESVNTTRLHAIWGIDQILRSSESTSADVLAEMRRLLKDDDATIRAAASKFAGERNDAAAIARLIELIGDSSARVRYFAVRALAELSEGVKSVTDKKALASSVGAVINMIATDGGSDPALRHAGTMYLADSGLQILLPRLATHENSTVRRSAVVALRRLQSGAVAKFLEDKDSKVVAEAVRAIHDTPIPLALDALRELPTDTITDSMVLHRVLNANFLSGSEDAATVVAKLAVRISTPEDIRIEALDMLGDWGSPSPLDRVTNQYHPIEPRPAKIARDALQPHINDLLKSSEVVREKAIQVASRLGMKSIVPQLLKRAADESQSPTARATALIALSDLHPEAALKLAKSVELTPTTALVPAALQVLSRGDRNDSLPTFINATKLRDVTSRQLAWDILRSIDDPKATEAIRVGAAQYLDSSLPADVRLNVREAAMDRLGEDFATKLAKFDEQLVAADPLSPWLDAVEGGDVERGKKLFFEKTELSCVRCHKVDRAGGEVGPNLTVIGKEKDAKYLLEAICLPSATIAKGYETAVIATEEGEVITGIIKTENDDFVELLLADGRQERIDQIDVVARKKGSSSMPNDLAKLLKPRELRDLVSYLASLKVDPRAEEETE